MKELTILRYDHAVNHTLGLLYEGDTYLADTLERPWLDNHMDTSCIPEGTYPIQKYISPKRGDICILLAHVPNRTGIEIHAANKVEELEGCIAVGVKSGEIVLHSRQKLSIILDILGEDIGLLRIKEVLNGL